RGQAVERLGHGLVRELHRLGDGLALYHLRRHGAGRDGAAAAEGLELDVGDYVAVYLQVYLHDVAALGVADLADAVRVLDDADVPGVAEMIHNGLAVKSHDIHLTVLCIVSRRSQARATPGICS